MKHHHGNETIILDKNMDFTAESLQQHLSGDTPT